MALIAVHLNAGHSGGDSVAIGIYSPSYLNFVHSYYSFHTDILPWLCFSEVLID